MSVETLLKLLCFDQKNGHFRIFESEHYAHFCMPNEWAGGIVPRHCPPLGSILQTHGVADDVTPFSMANASNKLATNILGEHAVIRYKNYQAGHTITGDMLNDAANFIAVSDTLTGVEYPMKSPPKN